MRDSDRLHRFVFDRLAVRGQLVHLDDTWRTVLARRCYPPVIQRVLGEALVAAALLSGSIKYQGLLSLQLQGQGALRLLLAQCTSEFALRGLARWQGDVAEGPLTALAGEGMLVITIEPGRGSRRYQGLVELCGASLAAALEGYFDRSEQLPTRLQLAAGPRAAAGLLLQRLPDRPADADGWSRIAALGATLSETELLELDAATLIRRLFHTEDVRLLESRPLSFRCSCSRQRTESVLRALGREEIQAILAEQGQVQVHCEFCGMGYCFDAIDAEGLFADGQPVISVTRH